MEVEIDFPSLDGPQVFVFRRRVIRAERCRWCIGGLGVGLALLGMAFPAAWWPGMSLDAKSCIVASLAGVSFLAFFLTVVVLLVSQLVVRLSPRGVWYGSVRRSYLPWTGKRMRILWTDVERLKWMGAGSRMVVRGRRRSVMIPGFDTRMAKPLSAALELHLSRFFDLSGGTVHERLRRQSRAWSWRRPALDKVWLVTCGSAFPGLGATPMLYAYGHPFLATMFVVCGASLVIYFVHLRRFGWQEPIACFDR